MDNESWIKYLRIGEEDFSGSCEVDEGARNLHRDLMKLFKGGFNCLDIGCGSGWSTEELSKMFVSATGITIQRPELDYARKNHSTTNNSFLYMDMHSMSFFENEAFDAVYMREALEHSIAPFIALCEVNRVLKMGGELVVNVPSQDWVEWHCHYFVPTDRQLDALLDKTGFSIIKRGTTDAGHIWRLCVKKMEAI